MADFKVPFGSQSGRRPPNADEKINGFPCGPADQQLFNGLFWRIESELGAILNDAGIVPSDDNLAQVLEAIQLLIKRGVGTTKIPVQNLNKLPWISVLSNTVRTPPEKPATGDTYLVADNALGDWTGYDGYIAEWSGTGWLLKQADDGHGVGLPDGTQLLRVGGKYWTQTAMDVQSGKWVFATTSGTDNNYMAYMTPAPLGVWAGAHVRLKLDRRNTGPATLNLNGLGAKPIVYTDGTELVGGDFDTGYVVDLTFDGKSWQIAPTQAYYDTRYSKLTAPPATTFYVVGSAGKDTNTGLAPTADEGFATIQGAINAISSKYITSSSVTLIVSPGTYRGFTVDPSFVNTWIIKGVNNDPDAVKVIATDPLSSVSRGVVVNALAVVQFHYMTFSGYYEAIACNDAQVSVENCNVILGGRSGSAGLSCYRGRLELFGNINISGTGNSAVLATTSGFIRLGYQDKNITRNCSLKYNGCVVNEANFIASDSGIIIMQSPVVYFSGFPTGAKYSVIRNGVLNTYGGGVGRIPGTKDGGFDTGGQVT